MAGTDSTFIGMAGFTASRGTVGHNTDESKRGNPNGDVVEKTATHNVMDEDSLHTNLSTNYGANIKMQAKAPEIQ